MTKSFALLKMVRAGVLGLSLILVALVVPVAAQNNSNAGGSATPAAGGGSSQTTTTTTQTTRSGGNAQAETNESSFPWIWVIVLGLVAIVAIAFFATRKRPANRDRV